MKLHSPLKSMAFAIAAMAASSANAGIITEWTVDVDAVFLPGSIVSTNGDASGITVSNGDQTLRWGNSGQSGLDINDSPSSTQVDTGVGVTLPPVANVSLTHTNNPIKGATLDTVTLSVSLTLTPFSPALPSMPPETINFAIEFLETNNGADPCADGGAHGAGVNSKGCGDIFVIGNDALNYSFFADSDGAGGDDPQEYFISFIELTSGLTSLPAEACLSATGSTAPCLGFVTPEKATTTFQFGAIITTEEVVIDPDPNPMPVPGILTLMGLALVAMGGARRRRRTV